MQKSLPDWCRVLLITVAAFSWGGRTPTMAEDGRGTLLAAFELTKQAQTVGDCSRIIDTCEAVAAGSLSVKMTDYRSQLLAWAYNRRGELFASQAAESDTALELDTKAYADFDRAVQLNPDHWKSWHNRGVSQAVLGRHEAAISDLSAALERKPEDADSRFNRGVILAEVGRLDEALADLDTLAGDDPRDSGVLVARSAVYRAQGKLDLALADCEQALACEAGNAAVHTQRGRIYEQRGEWGKAASDFRLAIEGDSNSSEAYLAAAWMMATCPAASFRNAQLAVDAAERGLALSGPAERWRALDVAAAAYAGAGRFDKAQQTAERAIDITPVSERAALEQRLAGYRRREPFRQPGRVAQAPHNQALSTPLR